MLIRFCSSEACLLQELFARLKASGILCAEMRNCEPLPYSTGANDLDIKDRQVKELMLDVIHQCSGMPIVIANATGFWNIYALGTTLKSGVSGLWWVRRLNCKTGVFFRRLRLLDEQTVWSPQHYRRRRVLAVSFLGVSKELIDKKIFPIRNADVASVVAFDGCPQIESMIVPMGKSEPARLRG